MGWARPWQSIVTKFRRTGYANSASTERGPTTVSILWSPAVVAICVSTDWETEDASEGPLWVGDVTDGAPRCSELHRLFPWGRQAGQFAEQLILGKIEFEISQRRPCLQVAFLPGSDSPRIVVLLCYVGAEDRRNGSIENGMTGLAACTSACLQRLYLARRQTYLK